MPKTFPDAVNRVWRLRQRPVGEVTDGEIEARILAEIEARLAEPARSQARAFYDRYMLYRHRGRNLAEQGLGGEDPRTRLEAIRALRREIFGADTAERLFGLEEAQAEASLALADLQNDPDLSDADRQAAAEEIIANLPEPLREARREVQAAMQLRRDEAELRASGASAAEIRSLREERFGVAAADRLEALDRKRAAWSGRVEDYRKRRDAILTDPTLSEESQRAAIDAIRQSEFDERERIRLDVLAPPPETGGLR